MYTKTKIHRGKLAECKLCLAKMAAQDPAFAAAFAKAAAAEKPRRKSKTASGSASEG